MSSPIRLRLGTRASPLARWQAEWVSARLEELLGEEVQVELVHVTTSGDQQQEEPIGAGTAPGLFTKEIQRALLDDRIDLAVHSLKDLPTEEVPGLCLAAVPERGPVGDVLVCREYASLDELPEKAAVGTGSLRRRAQLAHVRPDLVMKDIRGNVDTRLRKLSESGYDAVVLAEAGLRRLGLAEHITEVLSASIMLPAIGQGALGLETRSDDATARNALEKLDHPATHAAVLAERAMLTALSGGCLAPIAAWGRVEGGTLKLSGRVLSADGATRLEASDSADPADAEPLGRRVAEDLLAQGAAELIQALR
ncbi:MAG: hydroxymethylbilane synthase [Planctomycetota bacterium]